MIDELEDLLSRSRPQPVRRGSQLDSHLQQLAVDTELAAHRPRWLLRALAVGGAVAVTAATIAAAPLASHWIEDWADVSTTVVITDGRSCEVGVRIGYDDRPGVATPAVIIAGRDYLTNLALDSVDVDAGIATLLADGRIDPDYTDREDRDDRLATVVTWLVLDELERQGYTEMPSIEAAGQCDPTN